MKMLFFCVLVLCLPKVEPLKIPIIESDEYDHQYHVEDEARQEDERNRIAFLNNNGGNLPDLTTPRQSNQISIPPQNMERIDSLALTRVGIDRSESDGTDGINDGGATESVMRSTHDYNENLIPHLPLIIISPPEDNDEILDVNNTVNTSSKEQFKEKNGPNTHYYTSMNVAHSPFEMLTRFLEREKKSRNYRQTMKAKNKNSALKIGKHDFLNLKETEKHFVAKEEHDKTDTKTTNIQGNIEEVPKNVNSSQSSGSTMDSTSIKSPLSKKIDNVNGARTVGDEICSEPVETMLKKLESNNLVLDKPIWHSYSEDDQNSIRQELRISEITSEGSIELDREIEEWVSLENHAVGRGNHGLTLVLSHPRGFQVNHVDIYDHITAMCIFYWWNLETRTKSFGFIIAQDMKITWYQLQEDNQLAQIWYWILIEPVKALKIYEVDGNWKLAVSYEHSYEADCGLVIYGMNLWQNYWFEQRLNGCNHLTLANDGRYIVAVHSDMSTVLVHRYREEHRFYENVQNISSPNVQHISTFTAGPFSFLAIGGSDSAIYQIRGGLMTREMLTEYFFEHVEVWLPVNIGYYRNDIILLAQHRLHHDSHYSNAIEALHWNGERFTLMDHAPCLSHSTEMYGFICMADAENERGILGGTAMRSVHENVFILLASHEFTPSMFEIKTEVVTLPDPTVEKVMYIQDAFKNLKQKLINQLKILNEAKKMINNQKQRERGDLVNIDNIKIKELVAPAIHLHGTLKDFLKANGYVKIGDKLINRSDLELDITMLFQSILANHARIKQLSQKIERTVNTKHDVPKSFKNLQVQGRISVKGKMKLARANIESVNGLNTDRVLKETARAPKNGVLHINGKSVVQDLQIDNINTDSINNFDIVNPSKNTEAIIIYGDLNMARHVQVLNHINIMENGKLNNVNLKKDIITGNKKMLFQNQLSFENLKARHLAVEGYVNDFTFTRNGLKTFIESAPLNKDYNFFSEISMNTLSVGKNLYFETINGLPWKNFLNNAVFKSVDQYLDGVRVDGNITIAENLKMSYLNTLMFPNEYFMKDETNGIVVTGDKIFENELLVGEVDCEGKISGVDHDKIVTLSTNQKLDNFTFFDLTVTERMNVDGEITGKELDAFLSNPLLTETNQIKSNVIFKNLAVEGNVMVDNKINGTHFEELFNNIIKKTDNPLSIESVKTFKGQITVQNGVNIVSGFIKDKKINEFLTTDTEQEIPVENIHGYVSFKNIEVGASFDGVNISDLIENSINLAQDQSANIQLIFNDESIIEIKELNVSEKVNKYMITDLIQKDNLVFTSPQFHSLHVENLIVDGNVENSWSLSGVNLHDFEKRRLSKTKNQVITAPYSIKNCYMNELHFKYLNDKMNDEIYTNIKRMNDLEINFYEGNTPVRHLHVNGNMDILFLNNINMNQLIKTAVLLKEENVITAPITFTHPVHLHSLHITGNAYGKHFDKFCNDVVQRYDKDVVFSGRKIFANGLNVKGNVITNFLNNIEPSHILTTNTDQSLGGTIILLGNLTSKENIEINGFMNEIKIDDLSKSFKYLGDYVYQVNGIVSLDGGSSIHNLIVRGVINDRYNPNEILQNVVYTWNDNEFPNTVTFNKVIRLKEGLNIEHIYNGIDLNTLVHTVNSNDGTSDFKPPHANEALALNNDLKEDLYIEDGGNTNPVLPK